MKKINKQIEELEQRIHIMLLEQSCITFKMWVAISILAFVIGVIFFKVFFLK